MSDTTLHEQILRRLNLLILLQQDKASTDLGTTTTSKVNWLLGLGLPPAEVAAIVGKPVNYVTAITSSAKKASKRKDQRHGDK